MDTKKYAAEAIGTFWLTFAGCGSAVIAAGFPQVGIGLVGVSLAFGLSVVTMAYAIGHISGCHLNPAVTLGLAAGGRFPAGEILPYVIAQVIGAVVAAAPSERRCSPTVAVDWAADSSKLSGVAVGAGGCSRGHCCSSMTRIRDQSQRASSTKAVISIIGLAADCS